MNEPDRAATVGREFVAVFGVEPAIKEALRRAQHPEPRVQEFWQRVARLLREKKK